MKFFAIVFIILGILLIFAGIFSANSVYQFAYIPDPTPALEPGTPQLTGGIQPYSTTGSWAALGSTIGISLLGLAFIAQGTLFYTVGDINEKMDALLKSHERK